MTSRLDTILKRFDTPDEVREFEGGRLELVTIAGQTLGRATYQPGWKWSLHVGPAIKTRRCTVEHLGIVLSGQVAYDVEITPRGYLRSPRPFAFVTCS